MPGMDRFGEDRDPPVQRPSVERVAHMRTSAPRLNLGHNESAILQERLTATEMVIVNHAIAMLNQIGLSGADADKIIYGDVK